MERSSQRLKLTSFAQKRRMTGETNLSKLLAGMSPKLNPGDFVFVTTNAPERIPREVLFAEIKEAEGSTIILERTTADELGLPYHFVAAWITLIIHSSLEAVGLTAAFSSELAKHGISCNVVAGYYHDHLFVPKKDAERTIKVLTGLSEKHH